MFRVTTIFCAVLFVLCGRLPSHAAIIYVDVNGPNEPGTGTFYDPFRSIQNAIDAANSSDTIEIRPGIYTADPNNYNLDPNGKSITIRSTEPNNPDVVANTIIDPNRAGRGFCFINGETPNCVISGLTIQNGLAADDSGGAILCDNSSPTVSNCTIKNNSADWYGGAIYCYDSSPEIINCTITGNSAMDGGALECWSGTAIIQNCVISNNIASGTGGAIDCYLAGQVELNNCTVVENLADSGGGLRCVDYGKATIQNSILWSNEATKGAQIALEYSYPPFASEAVISYSNVQGGISAIYVDPCSILNWGSGNIDVGPYFASFDLNGAPNLWDFHLQSAYGRWDPNNQNWVYDANTSPCIDAGDPNSDWSSELWPNGNRINMGAYGGINQASMNGNRADFNIDGTVDFADYAEFSKRWLTEETCIEDLTGNNIVDFADVAIFADNWLWYKE
ncbi:MAG: hypothetical protein PHY02_10320 [Phycisphaerae bacterium]|nr:hypothetical protein [Phycisphaerae bacterium]